MSNIVGLDGDFTIAQPNAEQNAIVEGVKQKVQDITTIGGITQRIWLAQKQYVNLAWDSISQADYSYITAKFYGAGNTITYTNTASGVSFTGFATASEGPFIKGASFKRSLTITITQR